MKRCLLICSLVLVFALLLSACGVDAAPPPPAAPAPAPASDYDFEPAAPEPAPDEAAEDFPAAPAVPGMPDASAADTEGSPGPPPILTPSDSGGRRLIYTVNMQLQTTEFMAGIRLLYDTISELDGFIVSESVRGRDIRTPEVERSASYDIRLYTDNLPSFIVVMEDNFNLLSRALTAEDITAIYEDASFTLRSLRELEEQLLDELDEFDDQDMDAIFDEPYLEMALAEIQSHIRSLEVQQYAFDDDILFSFINVQIFEAIIIEEIEEEYEEGEEEEVVDLTFGERFNNAASVSWEGFLGFLQGFLIVVIRILPTLLIIGAVTAVAFFAYRKVIKKRKQNSEQHDKR